MAGRATPLRILFPQGVQRRDLALALGLGFLAAFIVLAAPLADRSVPRVGVEFVHSPGGRGQLALRAGFFRMPDDRIRMSSFNSVDPDVNDAYLEAFRGGEEMDHVTAGVGYSFGRSSFEIAGAVLSSTAEEA